MRVSSFVFGVLHVIYGNAALPNATGGLVLATIFVITESWPAVVVAHSVGNLAILIFNVLVS
jgi:membrane protease YdiL (CAAX protease family)